jgi:hypothetical protein
MFQDQFKEFEGKREEEGFIVLCIGGCREGRLRLLKVEREGLDDV